MTSQKKYQRIADVCGLLSHPERLHILDELRRQEACVCHLQAVLERPQAYVSQQLRVLRQAGVVTDHRDGIMVYYQVADDLVIDLLEKTLGPAGEPSRPAGCSCPMCGGQEGA